MTETLPHLPHLGRGGGNRFDEPPSDRFPDRSPLIVNPDVVVDHGVEIVPVAEEFTPADSLLSHEGEGHPFHLTRFGVEERQDGRAAGLGTSVRDRVQERSGEEVGNGLQEILPLPSVSGGGDLVAVTGASSGEPETFSGEVLADGERADGEVGGEPVLFPGSGITPESQDRHPYLPLCREEPAVAVWGEGRQEGPDPLPPLDDDERPFPRQLGGW